MQAICIHIIQIGSHLPSQMFSHGVLFLCISSYTPITISWYIPEVIDNSNRQTIQKINYEEEKKDSVLFT
jgi:hypothetical protein